MKNIKTLLYMLAAVAFLFTGCKTDDLDLYSVDNSSICFETNFKEVSFIDTPELEYLDVEIPVVLVGPAVDYDREISYTILEETTTANPQQYQILDAKVKAGALSGAITVRVINDRAVLEDGTLELELQLEPNDRLAVDLKSRQSYNLLPFSTAKLSWTSQIIMPSWLLQASFLRYISYTPLYRDAQYMYGEQNAEGTRIRASAKYTSNGLYSRNLMKILREIWPDKINVNGHLGLDEETLAKYPMVTMGNDYCKLLVHKLETYIYEYNKAHPDAPLRHSDDAACYNAAGAIPNVTSGGVVYKLEIKENPPILVNPYNM